MAAMKQCGACGKHFDESVVHTFNVELQRRFGKRIVPTQYAVDLCWYCEQNCYKADSMLRGRGEALTVTPVVTVGNGSGVAASKTTEADHVRQDARQDTR